MRNAGQKPVSESSSGVARTHPSLGQFLGLPWVLHILIATCTLEDTAYDTVGPVAVEKRFVCRDGVEARRLLVITRNDLLREAKELYAGNAICEEAWRIRIFKRGKGSLYNVYVSKECSGDRMVPDLHSPRFTTRARPSLLASSPTLANRCRLNKPKGSPQGL
jgi:hypothetical protein